MVFYLIQVKFSQICLMAFVSSHLSIDALKLKTMFQISDQNVLQLEVQEVAFVQASVVKVNHSFGLFLLRQLQLRAIVQKLVIAIATPSDPAVVAWR